MYSNHMKSYRLQKPGAQCTLQTVSIRLRQIDQVAFKMPLAVKVGIIMLVTSLLEC